MRELIERMNKVNEGGERDVLLKFFRGIESGVKEVIGDRDYEVFDPDLPDSPYLTVVYKGEEDRATLEPAVLELGLRVSSDWGDPHDEEKKGLKYVSYKPKRGYRGQTGIEKSLPKGDRDE